MPLLENGFNNELESKKFRFALRPTQLLVVGFGVVIIVGAILLSLPMASNATPLGFIDALFTSTSAVCVTGLVVVDTGSRLTGFGQAVVLILFQVGGLGIMTFSTLLLLAAGSRPSLAAIEATGETIGSRRMRDVRTMVRGVVLITLLIEGIAFVLLSGMFIARMGPEDSVGSAIWSALFHSVSAFCNAGFGLEASSLEKYRASWDVNLVIMALIILGGIGFPVMRDIKDFYQSKKEGKPGASLTLHTKIVLITTLAALVLGTVAFFATEYTNANTLAPLSTHERLLSSMFQSTTARTAGFSTVDIGKLAPATLTLMIILMFIGASPCSTGGGIKTSTIGVLAIVAWSKMRGREEPSAFSRSIPRQMVMRAVTLALLSGIILLVFIWLLMVCEGETHGFSAIMFEVVSAFGTVGLSTGITSELAGVSKIMLSLLMFIGRLGPLTIVVSISKRELPDRVKYPAESVMVG